MTFDLKKNLYLKNVAIIVRYCWIEEPYWIAFINHYHLLGVNEFYVLVQYKEDKKNLENFYYKKNITVNIRIMPSSLTPNNALLSFDLRKLSQKSKYFLLVDADEFIFSFNNDIDISDLIQSKRNLNIRWVMNPITNNETINCGYFGSETKPIAYSKKVSKIKSCHSFEYKSLTKLKNSLRIENGLETTKYGLVLIHNWSRSLIDCLLKSSFSNNPHKIIDQENIVQNIKKGKLNARTKYLAFLDIQNRYINNLPTGYIKYFDYEKEKELIMRKYNESDLELYFQLFRELKEKLSQKKHTLESYPPFKGNILEQMKRLNKNNTYG